MPVRIHKPDRVMEDGERDIPTEPGWVGEGKFYFYRVRDIRNGIIPELEGYRVYERLHLDVNKDGLGGPWKSNLIDDIKANSNPYPGLVAPEGFIGIVDRVQLFVLEGTTTQQIDEDAMVRWHNSLYLMDVYLKKSTYRYTFTPIIQGETVVDLKLDRRRLRDSRKVTEADDDID